MGDVFVTEVTDYNASKAETICEHTHSTAGFELSERVMGWSRALFVNVSDFSLAGLVYESDSSTGYCKINPAWGLGGMPTPASIFGLDQAYVYNGKVSRDSCLNDANR